MPLPLSALPPAPSALEVGVCAGSVELGMPAGFLLGHLGKGSAREQHAQVKCSEDPPLRVSIEFWLPCKG